MPKLQEVQAEMHRLELTTARCFTAARLPAVEKMTMRRRIPTGEGVAGGCKRCARELRSLWRVQLQGLELDDGGVKRRSKVTGGGKEEERNTEG